MAQYGGTAPKFCMFYKRGFCPYPLWSMQNLGNLERVAHLSLSMLVICCAVESHVAIIGSVYFRRPAILKTSCNPLLLQVPLCQRHRHPRFLPSCSYPHVIVKETINHKLYLRTTLPRSTCLQAHTIISPTAASRNPSRMSLSS